MNELSVRLTKEAREVIKHNGNSTFNNKGGMTLEITEEHFISLWFMFGLAEHCATDASRDLCGIFVLSYYLVVASRSRSWPALAQVRMSVCATVYFIADIYCVLYEVTW